MENKEAAKISKMEGLSRLAIIFVFAYLKARKDIFGNYDGYRRGALMGCFYEYMHRSPESFPESFRNAYPDDWPREIMPRRNERMSDYVSRFDITGVETDIGTLAKVLMRPHIIRVEKDRIEKAIKFLNVRKNLPIFSREIKKVLK